MLRWLYEPATRDFLEGIVTGIAISLLSLMLYMFLVGL